MRFHWLDIIKETLQQWWVYLVKFVPNLVLALMLLLIVIYIGKGVRHLIYRIIRRVSAKPSVSNLFANVIYAVIVGIGIVGALDILQLDKAVSSLLAGAGILGLILGFAFQDITANFISGIFIALRKPFDVGHTIKTNDFMGNIEEISLRTTTMRTFDGLHLMIPNRDIFQKPLINYSLTPERRIDIPFSIATTSDLVLAKEVALAATANQHYLLKNRPAEFYYTSIEDNAINVMIWIWIDNHQPPGFMVARHETILNVMQAFEKNGIEIIAPITLRQLGKGNVNP